ncbi:DUF2125 domain-containing protein [Rhodovulum adriaticum]|uniref:DUF2125 domain-containing protein n=1 Tax=Rhodovulum adriaticum TaxID=35804 RepID=A0A4R2NL88_RHOAD|nr:DUF2125 domain-containing protein [Rhodovulum adriaticum]MBK1635168.1 hypothetical protein [Rhodovulum adriaticum]TCP22281.1 hypothetical protein EV656_10790 [Rhodovulum adriaticum]
MRVLLGLVTLLAVIWAGYWALAARGLETGLSRWVEARRAEGWAADYAGLAVTGFPARFDTAFTGLSLADPETGLAWSAPHFAFTAASHRPQAITAIWPPSQQIATPREKIAVNAALMQGRLEFRPGPALALIGADYRFEDLRLTSTAGWMAAAGRADLTSAAVEGQADVQMIDLQAQAMRPPARLLARLDRAGVLPDVFDRLAMRATLSFDAPWDRRAVEDRRPQITRLDLDSLDAKWGDLELRAAGTLEVDAQGLPQGTLTLRATNWREMVEIARASGQLPAGVADNLTRALAFLAGRSGRPETLDIPLRFAGGSTWLGPVPVGPAPDFTIR